MPLSAAERQRRYKAKLKQDPQKYEESKRKKRENYHIKKRLVSELTVKEKHNARIIWRLRKQKLRRNQNNLNQLLDLTPASSPSILQNDFDPVIAGIRILSQQSEDEPDVSRDTTPNIYANRKVEGRKKVRKDRSKLFRENLRLQEENEKLKKKYEKIKKRYQRTRTENVKEIRTDENKYKTLSSAIKNKHKSLRKHKEKKLIKNMFESVDASERQELITETLGIKGLIRASLNVGISKTKLKAKIEEFFHREDISRPTAGKKETITRMGEKVQKRFLLDTMKTLYQTFKLENSGLKCSYYYFTQNKPFYVMKPTVSGREMCLCKSHTNPKYKATALKNKNVIDTDDLNQLITATACDTKTQDCMYGTCNSCSNLMIKPNDTELCSRDIDWKEWGRVEEVYNDNGIEKKVFKNVPLTKSGKISELLELFNKELKLLKKHVFNMKIQFANFRKAVDDIRPTEAVIVADFSENYSCKHHEEIQAHHFGGSRQQVSLHTVVVYILSCNTKKVESYCTLSSSKKHNPAAIWAHLEPVLKEIKTLYPDVTTVHFWSDGPFSQYRQKQNFYLSSTLTFDLGFKAMSWSFFEAGHGKGPADGIGGYLKRSADDMVARGIDISSTDSFYDSLKDVSKIKLFKITPEDIQNIENRIPSTLQALPGTKTLHQIFSDDRGKLQYRNLSCFCKRSFCDCLSPKVCKLLPDKAKPKKVNKKLKPAGNENKIEEVFNDEMMLFNKDMAEVYRRFLDDDVLLNSDKDMPLINYKVPNEKQKSPLQEIQLLELSQTKNKSYYNIVYATPDGSDEEQGPRPSCSKLSNQNKENCGVKAGDFLLVNVKSDSRKIFKYVYVVNELQDDGDITVTYLRSFKNKSTFIMVHHDVSDIDYTDIIEILSKPALITKRGQIYYNFKSEIDIKEK